MENTLQPLEAHAKELLEASPNDLPNRTGRYWERYTHLLASLREHVYPHINAGLACLSKSPGIYTDHGGAHFDEVVRYAGQLLMQSDGKIANGFSAYELYLLLCAIRLHDAGNIDGREDHERRVSSILGQYGGSIIHDSPEFDLICNIAEAHGGHTLAGSKDTIATLPPDDLPLGGITCRPRQVAAMVRFADEICEHRARAASHHIRNNTLPEENKLFQYYAVSIIGAVPDRRAKSFRLHIGIDDQYLRDKYKTPKKPDGTQEELFLIDEIVKRLTKLDCERVYCNQFLDPRLQTDQLDIEIRILTEGNVEGNLVKGEVEKFKIKIPPQSGYPDSTPWQNKYENLSGEKIAARANQGWK